MKINALKVTLFDLVNRCREEGFANYKMNVKPTQENFDIQSALRSECLNKEGILVKQLTDLNKLLEDVDDFLANEEYVAYGEGARGIADLRSRISEFLDYKLKQHKHQTNE